MQKIIKQLTPLIYALGVVVIFSLLGIGWFKVKSRFNIGTSLPTVTQGSIPSEVKKIGKNEPVRGNSKAKYAVIEYSDYDCPFCKDFHLTMKELISENPDFKWVFRQFPLAQLHPNAGDKAKAALCVYKEQGNDAFWEFSDQLYENQSLTVAQLTSVAEKLNVAKQKFEDCTSNFDTKDFDKAFDLARQMGVTGTPTSVIVNTDNGNATMIVGSQSKDEIISKAKSL